MRVEPAVSIIASTPDPERVVAAAARACWSQRPVHELYTSLSDHQVGQILRKVILRGHTSVLEHAEFTFELSGVSRVLTHQLVRHRIASYSQLSQQRVDHSNFGYAVPPSIAKDPMLLEKYEQWMAQAEQLYTLMVKAGVPRGSARYVIPAACETRIVVTINARSLFNLIAQRACGAEDWEFRIVATRMHQELLRIAPRIFQFAGPRCKTAHECTEGEVGDACRRGTAFGASVRFRDPELQRA